MFVIRFVYINLQIYLYRTHKNNACRVCQKNVCVCVCASIPRRPFRFVHPSVRRRRDRRLSSRSRYAHRIDVGGFIQIFFSSMFAYMWRTQCVFAEIIPLNSRWHKTTFRSLVVRLLPWNVHHRRARRSSCCSVLEIVRTNESLKFATNATREAADCDATTVAFAMHKLGRLQKYGRWH